LIWTWENVRKEEENNLPQMKKLIFLYVWLNLTRIAELRKEDLVKHIRKITIQTSRLFFSSSLSGKNNLWNTAEYSKRENYVLVHLIRSLFVLSVR